MKLKDSNVAKIGLAIAVLTIVAGGARWVGSVDARLNTLTGDVDVLKDDVAVLKSDVAVLKVGQAELNRKVDILLSRRSGWESAHLSGHLSGTLSAQAGDVARLLEEVHKVAQTENETDDVPPPPVKKDGTPVFPRNLSERGRDAAKQLKAWPLAKKYAHLVEVEENASPRKIQEAAHAFGMFKFLDVIEPEDKEKIEDFNFEMGDVLPDTLIIYVVLMRDHIYNEQQRQMQMQDETEASE